MAYKIVALSENKLWRNIYSSSFSSLIAALAQLLLVVLLPRILESSEFSLFLQSLALIGILEITSDFGSRVVAVNLIARSDRSGKSNPLLVPTIVKILFSALTLVTLFLMPVNELSNIHLFLIFLVAMLQPSTDPLIWYFRGTERLDVEAGLIIGWRLLNVLGALFCAYIFGSCLSILSWYIVTAVLRVLAEGVICKRIDNSFSRTRIDLEMLSNRFINNKPAYEAIKKCIFLSVPIGFAFFVTAFFQRFGLIYLANSAVDTAVIAYGIAFTLVSSAGFVATSITNSFYPRFSRAVGDGDWAKAEANLVKQIVLISGVCAVVFVGYRVFGMYLIDLLYPSYGSAIIMHMNILLVGLLPSTMNLTLKLSLNSLGLNWYDFSTVLTGIAILFLIVLVFDNLDLSVAIAYGWCVGETVMFLTKSQVLRQFSKIRIVGMLKCFGLAFVTIIFIANV